MKETLQKILSEALEALNSPECNLEEIRIKYLGKKGELTAVLRGMGQLSPEERPVVGQIANEVRAQIEAKISELQESQKARELENALVKEKLDVTVPGKTRKAGKLHPLTQVQRKMEDIFI